MSTELKCPCGNGPAFAACCGRFLNGGQFASTAEELMRSRYSAFATSNVDYLLNTWHPTTRPLSLDLDDGHAWTRLEVHGTTGGGMLESAGTVEFTAHYRYLGKPGTVRENSAFERVGGRWHYIAEAR
jgi:SEC-C motif-containing protein